ncbi:MAG: chromate transporter [Clostridia bacterium]|nr:chromate transporter [Clostridia bacterium]
MLILLELLLTFLKVGATSFGGGYGMIPLLSEEVIIHGWMTAEEFRAFLAVAESTPGPIAINMATFIGSQVGANLFPNAVALGRFLGAFIATFGVVLPAFVIILIIVAVVNKLMEYAGVKAFLSGIRPVVIGLITATGITMLLEVMLGIKTLYGTVAFDWKALVIFLSMGAIYYPVKLVKKKTVSPILLIAVSAVLGILLYSPLLPI